MALFRAQFGMDIEGNYRQQSLVNMQRAVYKGELSVVDYNERQVRKFNFEERLDSGKRNGLHYLS
jgi:hypothetical protein